MLRKNSEISKLVANPNKHYVKQYLTTSLHL